jgi:hypothetical protein
MPGLFDNITEYVQLSAELQRDLRDRWLASEQRADAMQKQASATQLPSDKVEAAVDALIKVNLLHGQDKEACVQRVTESPEILLTFIDKLAEMYRKPAAVEAPLTIPPLGKVRAATAQSSSEPTGKESDQVWNSGIHRLQRIL